MRVIRAFTITELLVVVAIITVIAAVMFPVIIGVKSAAKRSWCAGNFRQAYMGTEMYVADYDDRLMLTNYQPGAPPTSKTDRTWVQLVLPYVSDFSIFKCPADYGERPSTEATFDQDLVPGDTTSRYYQASERSNIGYNYLYLAPVVQNDLNSWQVQPRFTTEVEQNALLFVDTVYEVKDGHPEGGGSYLVIPPCRYQNSSQGEIDGFFNTPASQAQAKVLVANDGWNLIPDSTYQFGLSWPWHSGRMMTMRLGGAAKALSPSELSAGCDVRANWQGLVVNPEVYIWRTLSEVK